MKGMILQPFLSFFFSPWILGTLFSCVKTKFTLSDSVEALTALLLILSVLYLHHFCNHYVEVLLVISSLKFLLIKKKYIVNRVWQKLPCQSRVATFLLLYE